MTTKPPRVYSDLAIPPWGNAGGRAGSPRHDPKGAWLTRLGRPPQVVNEIINGKKAITPDTAIGLCQGAGH